MMNMIKRNQVSLHNGFHFLRARAVDTREESRREETEGNSEEKVEKNERTTRPLRLH